MLPAGLVRTAAKSELRGRLFACLVTVAAVAPATAMADEPPVNFNIPAKPLSAGLIDFAVQARISIGLQHLGSCGKAVRALNGRFGVQDGLRRMLAGSGCEFRRVDEHAFDVVPRPPRRRSPVAANATASSPDNADLSELVVVANRRPTPAERLAYSVSSISGATLTEQGVRDLNGLSTITPAMTLTNLGMGRDKVLLRGLSDGPLTGLTQSPVGLYLDDTRLTYNAPDPDLRLVDIERVEALRGPQSALYGSGALGGVLHLVTNAPDPNRASASIDGTVSFTEHGGPSHAVDGVLNVPVIPGRAAARLVLYHEFDGGYIGNQRQDTTEVNQASRDGGRFTVSLRLDPRWTVSAGAVMQRIYAADTQFATHGDPPDTRRTHLPEPHRNDFREYHLGLNGNLGWADAHVSVAYVDHDIFSRYDASLKSPVQNAPDPVAFDETFGIRTLMTEATLTSAAAAPVQWLAGAFFAHTQQGSQVTVTSFAPPITQEYQERRHDTVYEGALFGEATVPLYAGLSLTAGGRLYASTDSVTNEATSLGKLSAPFAGSVKQVGFAPKLVLAERLWPSLLVYLQAAEGYRGPGINTAAAPNELFDPAPSGREPLRYFKGDELWSYEAGAKFTALDGRLRLTIAAFDAEWKNVQSDQLLGSNIPFTANVGDGRNLGLEFEGILRIGALDVRTEMLLNNPVLTRVKLPDFALLANTGLGAIPDKSLGISVHYMRKLNDGLSLALDARVAYVGVSNLMLNIAHPPRTGDYTTTRLAATLVHGRLRFTVAVDNPADIQANTFAYGNPFTIGAIKQTTPLRPRTVSLGLEASF